MTAIKPEKTITIRLGLYSNGETGITCILENDKDQTVSVNNIEHVKELVDMASKIVNEMVENIDDLTKREVEDPRHEPSKSIKDLS